MGTTDSASSRHGDAGARIALALRNQIIEGSLRPGTRIRQEELADKFGASRVPVREALSILVSEGLVNTVSNSGSWVARLTLAECEEIYQMRERLEPLLLRMSAPLLTSTDFVTLEDLAHRIELATKNNDVDDFMHCDREFHLTTYQHARTQQLGKLIVKLWNSTGPYRRAYVSTWSHNLQRIACDEHNMLIAALREGELDDAELIIAAHIRRTRRQLSTHPEIFDA